MNAVRPAEILRQLEQSGTADDALLARFVATRDATAFTELVRRHGALVLGVCLRVTGHRQDAEDAFQATFLVLARRAATLRSDVRLWSWLYGVGYRVAWRARRTSIRRRRREITVAAMTEPLAPAPASEIPELMPVLDEELAALPNYYREAIVLCDLRGASRAEAAAVLGVPEGTLSSRLANGRKKLAARLTRRGVSLAVAALPVALAETQAGTAVSAELIATTCRTVADFAANGTVPGPLARLIKGGFAVRKTFVFGALVAIAAAGAVFAATARDAAPPLSPSRPPVVAVRSETPQPAVPATEPKPDASYTDAPRIAAGWDLPLTAPARVTWAPTGSRLAVVGFVPGPAPVGFVAGQAPVSSQAAFVVVDYTGKPDPENLSRTFTPKDGSVVGFTADGKQLITDRRENHLLSGLHQLVYWNSAKTFSPVEGGWPRIDAGAKLRTVTFDGADIHGYAFAPDGKSFRALRYRQSANEAPKTMQVIEIDTATGRAGKPLMQVDYGDHSFSTDGKRLAVGDASTRTVRVYDLEKRDKPELYRFALPPEKVTGDTDSPLVMRFSPDGSRLVASLGVARSLIINLETGTPICALEGTHSLVPELSPSAFSSDGRLFAANGQMFQLEKVSEKGKERTQANVTDSFLTVWDTTTGRVLKTWSGPARNDAIAFHPSRPLLAVAESKGDGWTRLGFWDFANEAEKK